MSPRTSGPHDTGAASATGPLQEAAVRVLEAGKDPLRAAFLCRALSALARLAPELGEQALGRAVAAPTDYATLLAALESPAAVTALRQDDPLTEARLRGLQARPQILQAEGGALTGAQVAGVLGISRQAVDKRRRSGRLLAVAADRRGYLYPAWQFTSEGVLPGLPEVLGAFTVASPWMQAAWFLAPNLYLDGARPLDALRHGQMDAVHRAAAAYGEQGAA